MSDQQSIDYRSKPNVLSSSNFRIFHLSCLAAIIGILAGFVAFALASLIGIISNLVFYQRFSIEIPSLEHHNLGALVLVVPVIGGLLIGLMAKYGTSKIRGHGIPEAMEAVLINRSRISPRVAILKPLSAAISIGTGGPFGAEGPIIQTGGALGSVIGQIIHVTAAERKVLLACGAAAGMAAMFSTPIAAVILAIELLLFEFKSRSFIPLVVSSTLATAVHFHLIGRAPMFEIAPVDFGIPLGLPFYAIFGLIAGTAAVGFSKILYWVEDLFERLPVDPMWWPAIGGLGLGIIGLFVPRVLGVGYETISAILDNQLPFAILVSVLVFKSLALFVTLGSGTSGGLLAPMLMAGAALGGIFAMLVNQIIPGANLAPGAFALVGMAAVFGSASRATFAFIIFAFEMTRDYNAVLPLMLTGVIADSVALYFMRNSIMTEKLARRGLRIHQEYEADVLQQLTVGAVMDKNPPVIPSTMLLTELADGIARHDETLIRRQALAIVDDKQQLTGIITRGDIVRALENTTDPNQTVLDVGNDELILTYPDEPLHDAVERMLRHNIGRLLVVNRDNPKQLVGYLGRSGVLEARLRRLEEEHAIEAGWLKLPLLTGAVRNNQ